MSSSRAPPRAFGRAGSGKSDDSEGTVFCGPVRNIGGARGIGKSETFAARGRSKGSNGDASGGIRGGGGGNDRSGFGGLPDVGRAVGRSFDGRAKAEGNGRSLRAVGEESGSPTTVTGNEVIAAARGKSRFSSMVGCTTVKA